MNIMSHPMKAEAYLRGFQVNQHPWSRHVTPHPTLLGPRGAADSKVVSHWAYVQLFYNV